MQRRVLNKNVVQKPKRAKVFSGAQIARAANIKTAIMERNAWIEHNLQKGVSSEVIAQRLSMPHKEIVELVKVLKKNLANRKALPTKTLPVELLLEEYKKGYNAAEITRLNLMGRHFQPRDYKANHILLSRILKEMGPEIVAKHKEARMELVEGGKIFTKRGMKKKQIPIPDLRGTPVTTNIILELNAKGLYLTDMARALGVKYKVVYKIMNQVIRSKEIEQQLKEENARARAKFFGTDTLSLRDRQLTERLSQEQSKEMLKAANLNPKQITYAKVTRERVEYAEKEALRLSDKIRDLMPNSPRVSDNMIALKVNEKEIQNLEAKRKKLQLYMGGWLPESEVGSVFPIYMLK